MTLTSEDLQAFSALIDNKLDEKLKPISDRLGSMEVRIESMDSRLESVETKVETLEIKQDVTTRKLEDINFRLTSLEYNNKKEFSKLNDEVETLIVVMKAKDILPKHG